MELGWGEWFLFWARDARVGAACGAAFARATLAPRTPLNGAQRDRAWPLHCAVIGAAAWANTAALLDGDTSRLYQDYALLCGVSVASYVASRGVSALQALAAGGALAALVGFGHALLGLRFVAAAAFASFVGNAYSSRFPNAKQTHAVMACTFAVAVATFIQVVRTVLPVAEFAEAHSAFERLFKDPEQLRVQTLILIVTGVHIQLALGACGVEYLRASQRRKNALLAVAPVEGVSKKSAKSFARHDALRFVCVAAVPYLLERTSLEAVYELSFRRYSNSLQRTLRLEAVLAHGEDSALDALTTESKAAMGTLDSYAKSLESSMRSMYQLTSRKVFSVPKLALVPRVLALHPIAAAAATPLFLVVDALKARLVAKISAEIEVRRKLATALESRRSKVEAHDSSKAQAITAVGAQEWNSRQWAALAAEVEAHQHVKTLLETIRRYVRWLYWSDFLTPAIEVALSAMLEHRLIEPDDLWVTARAFEDALDMALTRSRAESELAELKSDVERIDELNAALADVRKRETPRQCRVASDSDDVLRLFNVAYARGTTRVAAADVAAKRGDVLAVTGPNGCGKSTLFALLDACAHKRRLPRSLEFLEKENCAEGFASECAAESESFVQVPDGSVAHIAQRPYCPVDARPIDWIRYQPHLSDGAGEAAEALIISKLFSLLEFDSRQGTGDLKSAAGTNATLFEKHDDYCSTLSGGQQVKLEIVRQLLLPEKRGGKCAAVVLLDEIFSPLDPRSKAIVQRAIKVACPDSVVMAIYHADAGECVPGGDFFTGTLHFQPVPKGGVQITHKPTCA